MDRIKLFLQQKQGHIPFIRYLHLYCQEWDVPLFLPGQIVFHQPFVLVLDFLQLTQFHIFKRQFHPFISQPGNLSV
jgi:hypothetical protein